ncbi:MAG: DNA repair exonuclease [archaeon]|nr:DNA repair exonuclease [archaeon]
MIDRHTFRMKGSFRFIHCADLHLGCVFSGISSDDEEFGKRMKESMFDALNVIVKKVKSSKVDFVVFSGDIFDDSNQTPSTRYKFANALKEIGVPCYISYGNHDFKRKWESAIPLPENAYVFPGEVTSVEFKKDGVPVALLSGVSFSTPFTSKDFTVDVISSPELFNIGVFHCDLDSQDDKYAPCKLSSLRSKNVDYWALGHIHKRQIACESPYVVYPGNTQGKDSTESGEKGAYLVTVTEGIVSNLEFFRTGPIIWEDVYVDITGKENIEQLTGSIRPVEDEEGFIKEGSILKTIVKGSGPLDYMIRSYPDWLIKFVENETKCKVSSLKIISKPSFDFDIDSRKDMGDFVSAVINYSEKLETVSKSELIETICCTPSATRLKNMFNTFKDEELRQIVHDAMYFVIERVMGEQE